MQQCHRHALHILEEVVKVQEVVWERRCDGSGRCLAIAFKSPTATEPLSTRTHGRPLCARWR